MLAVVSFRVGGVESKMLLCRSVELSKVIRKAGSGWVASCFTASMGKVGKQSTLPACEDRTQMPQVFSERQPKIKLDELFILLRKLVCTFIRMSVIYFSLLILKKFWL